MVIRGRRKENAEDRDKMKQSQQRLETAIQLIRLQTIDRLYGRHAKPR